MSKKKAKKDVQNPFSANPQDVKAAGYTLEDYARRVDVPGIEGMHDSGKRQEFSTGAIRDAAEGKPRMELLTPYMIKLMADHMELPRLTHVSSFMKTNETVHLDLLVVDIIWVEADDTLIDRCGTWMAKGAAKYQDRNWERGLPVSRYLSSLLRHLVKWERDETDEDHAAAIVFNVMGIIFTRDMVKKGVLPAELDDWPPKHWTKETK